MRIPSAALVLSFATAAFAAPLAPEFSGDRMLAHIRVLSSDEFEGRGPGTRGEEKTVAYLIDAFKGYGLAPGNPDGTYVQHVPLAGITSKTQAVFTLGDRRLAPAWINDYVAVSHRVAPRVEIADSDVVFAGYGIVAPEYNWDDFKGVDVRGKTIIVLVNNPPFRGKAMTYYGRWVYKYEEASVLGAAACLIGSFPWRLRAL